MKIKYLGHASFLITSDSGIKIITDPYKTDESIRYGEIEESADIVIVSHEHSDHNNIAAVKGSPEVVRGTAKVRGIDFRGIPTYHDTVQGQQRGKNTVFCFEVEGVRVCHLGDLGHSLSDKQLVDLGRVDILLVPVGGYFTIDAEVASQICYRLAPRVVIPMHYKTDKCFLPIAAVDEFLQEKKNIVRLSASETEFKQGKLPTETQIIVLKPAL